MSGHGILATPFVFANRILSALAATNKLAASMYYAPTPCAAQPVVSVERMHVLNFVWPWNSARSYATIGAPDRGEGAFKG